MKNTHRTGRAIDLLIVHCTATKAGQPVRVSDIDRYHRSIGFNGVGYHYVVLEDGTIERGRDESIAGAHCRGYNAHSIGVAYAGGLDAGGRPADTRTAAQRVALRTLLGELKRRYPDARIAGHREFAAKACPCFDAAAEYSAL